jgi:predicted CopG family antitoxin
MPALNNAQLEILKLFKHEKSEEELLEIKKLLSDFLFRKAIKLADDVYEEKGYTQEDVESWKNEHFRLNTNKNDSSN